MICITNALSHDRVQFPHPRGYAKDLLVDAAITGYGFESGVALRTSAKPYFINDVVGPYLFVPVFDCPRRVPAQAVFPRLGIRNAYEKTHIQKVYHTLIMESLESFQDDAVVRVICNFCCDNPMCTCTPCTCAHRCCRDLPTFQAACPTTYRHRRIPEPLDGIPWGALRHPLRICLPAHTMIVFADCVFGAGSGSTMDSPGGRGMSGKSDTAHAARPTDTPWLPATMERLLPAATPWLGAALSG